MLYIKPRTYKGEVGGCYSPLGFFSEFFLDDQTSAPDDLGSCSFYPSRAFWDKFSRDLQQKKQGWFYSREYIFHLLLIISFIRIRSVFFVSCSLLQKLNLVMIGYYGFDIWRHKQQEN